MNSVFNNTYHVGGFAGNSMMEGNSGKQKPSLSLQPDSLFSMALYDFDEAAQQEMMAPVLAPQLNKRPGHFYPVDEYKDLSLREILEISDDLIFDNNDNSNNHSAAAFASNNHNDVVHRNFGSHLMQMPNAARLQQQDQHQAPVMPRVVEAQMEPQMIQSLQQEMMTAAPSVLAPGNNNAAAPTEKALPSSDIDLSPKKKRRRSEDDDSEDPTTGRRFRPYQAGQWSEKFEELCEYRERMGHCLVPHTFSENLPLARWVKRQRYQFKLMREGKSSTMTEDRVRALEEIGFVWDSQGAAWGERLAELKEFRQEFMHCNVPSNFSENPQLATWVKCQRRQYKLHLEGKPSNMTPQRIGELESLGFEWELRSYKKARTC